MLHFKIFLIINFYTNLRAIQIIRYTLRGVGSRHCHQMTHDISYHCVTKIQASQNSKYLKVKFLSRLISSIEIIVNFMLILSLKIFRLQNLWTVTWLSISVYFFCENAKFKNKKSERILFLRFAICKKERTN